MTSHLRRRFEQYAHFLWRRKFVRHVMTLQMGSIFSFIIGFIKSIVFARLLGIEGFGLYAVALSLMGTFKILLGFGHEYSFTIFLAEAHATKDRPMLMAVFRYFYLISAVVAAVALLLAVLMPVIADILYPTAADTIGLMAAIGFVTIVVAIPIQLVTPLLQTLGRIRMIVLLESSMQLMQFVLGTLFILLGFGPTGVFLGILLATIFIGGTHTVLFQWLRIKHDIPGMWECLRSGRNIGSYTRQGIWIALDKNIGSAYSSILLFLLSLASTPSVVGIVQIALRFSDLPASLLLTQVVRMTQTSIPALKHRGLSVIRTQCALLIKHTLLFHSTIIFTMMIVLPPFVLLAYGWQYASAITPALWLLLIRLLQPLNVPNVSILRMYHKMHLMTAWNTSRIFIELGIFSLLLRFSPLPALTALILIMLLRQFNGLLENMYVYGVLLRRTSA